MKNPDLNAVVVSYADDLAQAHSREIRRIVKEHSEFLGFSIAPDKSSVGRWLVDGHRGGVLAAGINSGLTGHGADLLIIDDPHKDRAEADSAVHRRRVLTEYQSTLATRLHPGASVLLVQTRWHEEDLAGELLEREPDTWRATNVPAVATAGVPDALHRAPGVAMVSANGYTAEDYAASRRTSGERAWAAMYLGTPTSPEGGLIKREWIDGHRLIAASRGTTMTVVGVDPADSGEGDETGIVAGSLARDGRIALTHDISARMTSDTWASKAVELAAAIGASRIVVEGYSAATTYVRLLRVAVERQGAEFPITVSSWPPKGTPRRGDALARSQGLIAALETGRCRIAGQLPRLESDMLSWEAGQHQPDSVAAAVITYETLAGAAGAQVTIAAPMGGRLGQRAGHPAIAGTDAQVLPFTSPWARRVSGR